MRKQALCDRLIAAPAGPGGIVVAAANVGCNGEIIRFALKREVVDLQKLIHDVAHLFRLHAEHKRRGGVYANAPRAVIKLQVAAACVVELLDERPIDLYEGGYKILTTKDGTQILTVPKGRKTPKDIDKDIIVLKEPVSDLYLVASGVMDMFDKLDAVDTIKFSGLDSDAAVQNNLMSTRRSTICLPKTPLMEM